MPLFKKKPPPVWYVLRPKKGSASDTNSKREGPYNRASIIRMYGEGLLGNGALLWTNEKIFPNAERPNSFRPVRIMEWRRLDQLPDPVIREFQADWQQMGQPQHANGQDHTPNAAGAANIATVATTYASGQPPSQPAPPAGPPPPSGGTPAMASPPQPYQPAPSSLYPAGVAVHENPSPPGYPAQFPASQPPPPGPGAEYNHANSAVSVHPSQMSPLQRPGAYPASGVYPSAPAPGAY